MWECPLCSKKICAGFGEEGIGHEHLRFDDLIESIIINPRSVIVFDVEYPYIPPEAVKIILRRRASIIKGD
jgi:hypothetical protein